MPVSAMPPFQHRTILNCNSKFFYSFLHQLIPALSRKEKETHKSGLALLVGWLGFNDSVRQYLI